MFAGLTRTVMFFSSAIFIYKNVACLNRPAVRAFGVLQERFAGVVSEFLLELDK